MCRMETAEDTHSLERKPQRSGGRARDATERENVTPRWCTICIYGDRSYLELYVQSLIWTYLSSNLVFSPSFPSYLPYLARALIYSMLDSINYSWQLISTGVLELADDVTVKSLLLGEIGRLIAFLVSFVIRRKLTSVVLNIVTRRFSNRVALT